MQTFQKILLRVLGFLKKVSIFTFIFLKKTSFFLYRCIRKASIILWKTFSKVFLFLKSLSIYIWKILKSVFNISMNIIGYIFLGASILLLFFIPVLYSGFVLGNTDYSYIVPYKIFVALLFILLMLVSLGTYFIMRKRFLLHFVGAFSALSLAFSFGFLGFTQMYNNHIHEGVYTQSYELESFSGSMLKLEYYSFDLYGDAFFAPFHSSHDTIMFEVSDTENFKIDVQNRMAVNTPETAEYYGNRLSPFKVYDINDVLHLELENKQVFSEKTNYVPLYRDVTIFIPKGRQVESSYISHRGFIPYCSGAFSVQEISGQDMVYCKDAQMMEAENIVEMILRETQGVEEK